MKLRYSSTTPGVEPIFTTLVERLEVNRQFEEWDLKIDTLRSTIRQQRSEGKEPDSDLYNELKAIRSQRKELERKLPKGQLEVLVSRCPYCNQEIWMRVGLFSLADVFWYREDSNGWDDVSNDSHCLHLFCVDGALNLNEHKPQIPTLSGLDRDYLWMAAEVPFIKPRVLNLPTMVAVVHSFPVAKKYTAYPIVYFAQQQPPDHEFCIAWARREHRVVQKVNAPSVGIKERVGFGKRLDVQEYELEKWVRQGKLFWLDPEDKEHSLISGPVEAFPYHNIIGRRNPYILKDGRVSNRPNPTKNSPPQFRWEEW